MRARLLLVTAWAHAKGAGMGLLRLTLSLVLLLAFASSGFARLSVPEYHTRAGMNTWGPLTADEFMKKIDVTTSPAVADLDADWTGANATGGAPTWHWVSSAHASSNFAFNDTSLTITGEASFKRDVTTTADFYDPNRVEVLYAPAAGGGFWCYFEVQEPATYSLSVTLNQYGGLTFADNGRGTYILTPVNWGTRPEFFTATATIPAGRYYLTTSAGLAGINFISGANHEVESGSFTDFSFHVVIPEPSCGGVLFFLSMMLRTCRVRQ